MGIVCILTCLHDESKAKKWTNPEFPPIPGLIHCAGVSGRAAISCTQLNMCYTQNYFYFPRFCLVYYTYIKPPHAPTYNYSIALCFLNGTYSHAYMKNPLMHAFDYRHNANMYY